MYMPHISVYPEFGRGTQNAWSWSHRLLWTIWCGSSEVDPDPLQEQQALLTSEPSISLGPREQFKNVSMCLFNKLAVVGALLEPMTLWLFLQLLFQYEYFLYSLIFCWFGVCLIFDIYLFVSLVGIYYTSKVSFNVKNSLTIWWTACPTLTTHPWQEQ